MRCITKIAGVALLSCSSIVNAGFNNESITWNARHSYFWRVVSFHHYNYNRPNDGYHKIDTGMSETWRQAAVHWNEAPPGATNSTYLVVGFHYYLDNDGRERLDCITDARDCSIYDGWWD